MAGEKDTKRFITPPLRDTDAKEILWRLYQDNYNNARHNETQRATVTNFIILIAGGISTIASVGGFTRHDLPLTFLLTGLGIYGALFSSSLYERYKRSKERAKAYLRELDFLLFETEEGIFKQIKKTTDEERKTKHPKLDKLYDVHWMWLFLPLLVAALGLILTGMCWFRVGESNSVKMHLVDKDGRPITIEQLK